MSDCKAMAEGFLKEIGLYTDLIDGDALLSAFREEMEAGLAGRESSLAMIPTYVGIDNEVPPDKAVVTLDAGGTNLRVGMAHSDATGQVAIDNGKFRKARMPGSEGREVDNDEFYGAFADWLEPVCAGADAIGFCFSYATEMDPSGDGVLLRWTKEIQAPGVVGTFVGRSILEKLAERGITNKKMLMLNDTVATLLAGKSQAGSRDYASYVGFILGTGTNTAYVESNANITKKPELDADACQAINCESGGFSKVPQSEADRRFDATTANEGMYKFEKMTSGGYLGGVAYHTLKMAAETALLSSAAAAKILSWEAVLENRTMDDFVWNPFAESIFTDPAFSETDLRRIWLIFSQITSRAALFAATNVSAAVIKTGVGFDPLHPVCVTIDGTTYYKQCGMRMQVERRLQKILGARGLHFDLVQVDEAPVLGAAVAGLTI